MSDSSTHLPLPSPSNLSHVHLARRTKIEVDVWPSEKDDVPSLLAFDVLGTDTTINFDYLEVFLPTEDPAVLDTGDSGDNEATYTPQSCTFFVEASSDTEDNPVHVAMTTMMGDTPVLQFMLNDGATVVTLSLSVSTAMTVKARFLQALEDVTPLTRSPRRMLYSPPHYTIRFPCYAYAYVCE